jgi:type IV pilus assembly protein PilA
MLQKIRNRKGFTLVELMIVVAIIGILAAIAIPNFLQFRLKAKTSEAKSNLGAIRSTEVAYFAEWDFYIGNQAATPIANRAGSPNKESWVITTRFSILGFAPEGSVFYSYALTGADFETSSVGMTMEAIGDLDDDSVLSTFYVTDSTNEILKTGGTF